MTFWRFSWTLLWQLLFFLKQFDLLKFWSCSIFVPHCYNGFHSASLWEGGKNPFFFLTDKSIQWTNKRLFIIEYHNKTFKIKWKKYIISNAFRIIHIWQAHNLLKQLEGSQRHGEPWLAAMRILLLCCFHRDGLLIMLSLYVWVTTREESWMSYVPPPPTHTI